MSNKKKTLTTVHNILKYIFDCLFVYLLYYVSLKNFSLMRRRHKYRWKGCIIWAYARSLWAGKDLYRATPALTRELGFSSLIRRAAVTLKIGPRWKMTLGSFFNIKYWPWSKFNVIFWSKVVVEKWSTLNFGQYEGHFLTTARTSDRVTSQH